MTAIKSPGVYALTDAEYHADPCPEPSLSRSIATILLDQTPRHAWTAHSRLNPTFKRRESETFDIGTAAHALMLGGEERFVIVEADDWRTKVAKEAREAAYAAGKTPILGRRMGDVRKMVEAGRRQIAALTDEEDRQAFRNGKPEQAIIWQEGETWCRIKLDWLPNTLGRRTVFHDYKTTGESAHPNSFARSAFSNGYDIQDALYLLGIRRVLGLEEAHFRFIVQESFEPYALSVCELSPAAHGLAIRRTEQAIALWQACVKAGRWPAYPSRCAYIDAPGWVEKRQEEYDEHYADKPTAALLKTFTDWQRPL